MNYLDLTLLRITILRNDKDFKDITFDIGILKKRRHFNYVLIIMSPFQTHYVNYLTYRPKKKSYLTSMVVFGHLNKLMLDKIAVD